MSDIFLSYKSEDRAKAQIIADALGQMGYSVWWDRVIPPGRTYDDVIEENLNASKCVIVLWSKESVKSQWVKTEASEGNRRGILIPIFIEDVQSPLAFRMIEGAKLENWQGQLSNPEFSLLLKAVEDTIGKPPAKISELEKAVKNQKAQEEKTRSARINKKKKSDLPEATLPVIDITSYMNPIRDQGNEGSNVGFATAAALEYQIYKKLKKKVIISPQYIYYLAKIEAHVDPLQDTGSFIKDAVRAIRKQGAILEEVWPYDPENFQKVPSDQINKAEKYKITDSYELTTVNEVKSAIQKYGPAVAGFTMYDSFLKTSKTGIIADPVPDEKIIGGHAVCIVGYDDDKKLFKFRNSWGNKWGEKGYGYLSYDYIKNHSSDNWVFWI